MGASFASASRGSPYGIMKNDFLHIAQEIRNKIQALFPDVTLPTIGSVVGTRQYAHQLFLKPVEDYVLSQRLTEDEATQRKLKIATDYVAELRNIIPLIPTAKQNAK